ncbi:MAG: hypothetical protein FWH49_01880 [Clostridiales bacterium]|nr:hypothetical protein [Clostridiales bacterium]
MVIAMLTAMSSSLCAAGNIEAGIAEETTVADLGTAFQAAIDEHNTATNLAVWPSLTQTFDLYWAEQDGIPGVYYKRGENEGFIAIPDISLVEKESPSFTIVDVNCGSAINMADILLVYQHFRCRA